MLIVSVAIQIPIFCTFDYFSPKHICPVVGGRVLVPFKKKKVIGIVISITSKKKKKFFILKPIYQVLDKNSLFSESLWKILNWAQDYYHYPIGKILFQSLPKLLRKGKLIEVSSIFWKWEITEKGKNFLSSSKETISKNQKKVLLHLISSPIYCYQTKFLELNFKTLKNLHKKGFCHFISENSQRKSWTNQIKINEQRIKLNSDQNRAVNAVRNKNKSFNVWLLFGITGSGKTEVYLNIISQMLSEGKQALILVPEIGLTFQIISKFQERFNAPIEVLHSKLSDKEKLSIWIKTRKGENAIVIGTRSAVFTPFFKLGIIIIDEEHDCSYKQCEGWRYHARNIAIFRAKEENIPIILGTATPSFETIHNVNIKKYQLLTLNKKAQESKPINHKILDIRNTQMFHGFSKSLLEIIQKHILLKNQVIVFLNRRGFAPIFLCHICGWIAKCIRCDHHFTLHKNKFPKLRCHYCNNNESLPDKCNQCKSSELITVGLGTEQVEIILSSLFPNIPITRIDRDTTLKKRELSQRLDQIKEDGARILIGTQMLAKGHHFPNVTLVALLDTDNALFSDNFRASEYFSQLYIQVSGRAGREKKPGEVVLQTHYPTHPLLKTLLNKGYMVFAQYSLKERYKTNLPPYFFHIAILANDINNIRVETFLKKIKELFKNNLHRDGTLYLGPSPALIPKRNKKYYWKLLLSNSSRIKLHNLITSTLSLIYTESKFYKINFSIDVDPIE